MKIKTLLLSVSIALISPAALATPIGRPIGVEGLWRAGGIVSYEEVQLEGKNFPGRRSTLKSEILLGEASYGFTDGAEFVVRVGGSKEKNDAGPGLTASLSPRVDWGVGIRGVMWDSYQDWRLLGDIQYFSRPGRSFGAADIDIWQWQMASAVEWRIRTVYPYAGVSFGKMIVSSNNESIFRSSESRSKIGFYGGFGIEPRLEWTLFAEAHVSGTRSISGGANYRF